MKLQNLIGDKKLSEYNINILGLSEDSREIKNNYIFFLKNKKKEEDEEKHILEAINKGAKIIIYSKNKSLKAKNYSSECIFHNVHDLNKCMYELSKVLSYQKKILKYMV